MHPRVGGIHHGLTASVVDTSRVPESVPETEEILSPNVTQN